MKRRSRVRRGRVRFKIGDIIAIPLEGRFAFGRLLRDCGIQIYDVLKETVDLPDDISTTPTKFFSAVMDHHVKSRKWPIVGHLDFEDLEDEWSPPTYIQDLLDPRQFRIYAKGIMQSATRAEVRGLEQQVLYFPEGFVEELERRFNVE